MDNWLIKKPKLTINSLELDAENQNVMDVEVSFTWHYGLAILALHNKVVLVNYNTI